MQSLKLEDRLSQLAEPSFRGDTVQPFRHWLQARHERDTAGRGVEAAQNLSDHLQYDIGHDDIRPEALPRTGVAMSHLSDLDRQILRMR